MIVLGDENGRIRLEIISANRTNQILSIGKKIERK